MRASFIAILIAICASAYAQKGPQSPIKYGEIPMEDMKMTSYPLDSSASAVVLVDYGIAYVNVIGEDAQINFERHVRIKILTKDGLDFANSSIIYASSSNDQISKLRASSYNLENGKIVETELQKEGVFKDKYNKYLDQQKFTIPNVKVGSIIEYTYKKRSDSYTNFPSWKFQSTIPTRVSEYWAMIPEVFAYERYMQGYVSLAKIEQSPMNWFNTKVVGYHYVANNVPAFKPEPYMTDGEDYLSKLNFALSHINYSTHQKEIMGSWAKLNENLLKSESFGKVIDGSSFLKERVEQLTAGMSDPLQKIAAISNYIKQNVEYDGDEDWAAYPSKKVLEKKKGSSGDINIMYASMLQKAGLETDMVVLSTRDHGFVREQFPLTRQFNYVVCAVKLGDKTLLLDATEKHLPYDVLPSRCLNGRGLVISEKNHGWIELTTKAKAKGIVNADMVLDPEGSLKGKVLFSYEGYNAQKMRSEYAKEGKDGYIAAFTKSKQWQIEKTEFENVSDLSKAVKESHVVSIPEHTSVAGDVIYINPFLTGQIVSNPFKSSSRIYPVDFGTAIDQTYMAKFTIPDGYVVDELPTTKLLGLPGNSAKYMINVTQIGNSVNITSVFQINKSLFTQEEYPVLKEFYNQVVAKQAEQIVIKKK